MSDTPVEIPSSSENASTAVVEKSAEEIKAEVAKLEKEADELFRFGWKLEFGYYKHGLSPEDLIKKRIEVFTEVKNLHIKTNKLIDTHARMEAIRAIEKKLEADAILREVEGYDSESVESCKEALNKIQKAEDIYYACMQIDGVYCFKYKQAVTKFRQVKASLETLQEKDEKPEDKVLNQFKGRTVIEIDPKGYVFL